MRLVTSNFHSRFTQEGTWLAILAAVAGVTLSSVLAPQISFVALLAGGSGLLLLRLPYPALFPFYFSYLMLEGAFKVWSHYHPLVHVGSDVILLFVFYRLWLRQGRERIVLDPKTARSVGILMKALCVYWLWVLLQFINPSNLGFAPSLAGLKLHVMPILCFVAAAYLLKKEELAVLPMTFLCLGVFQTGIAIIDWGTGPALWASLNPQYGEIFVRFLNGLPYRPFGTTYLPGAPSVWVFHTALGALLAWHAGKQPGMSGARWGSFKRALLTVFIPLATLTLVVCQVRLAFIRTAALSILGLVFGTRRGTQFLVVGSLAVLGLLVGTRSFSVREDYQSHELLSQRVRAAATRMATLGDAGTWQRARNGAWAFRELARRSSQTISGVGLSRVSASSAPWAERIAQDRTYGPEWSFADNLFLAIFTELGLGGLLVYVGMLLTLVGLLFARGGFTGWLIGSYCLLMIVSGYASEGLLYQPDASPFWLFTGYGLRMGSEGASA